MATQVFFICLVAGLILVGGEIFVPGGVLGAIGGLLLLGAIVDAFIAFPAGGPYIALLIVLFIGLAFYLWIRIFPHTGTGKAMTVSNDLKTYKASDDNLDDLVGKEGVAVSQLRPAGFVMLAGRRIDVMTRGEMIEKDAPVRVVAVSGNNVVVAAAGPKS
ncbi:MAG: hypothetical protein K8T26_07420 [Lentisphaerae bacterium]|nr:hypothetical protein [Lentisphaerota bacterium]